MEDLAGSCGHIRPKHAWIALNIYDILYLISTQKIRTFDGSKAFPCIFGYNFWPKNSKNGHKARRTFSSSQTAFLGFDRMRESSRIRTFNRTPNWTTLPKRQGLRSKLQCLLLQFSCFSHHFYENTMPLAIRHAIYSAALNTEATATYTFLSSWKWKDDHTSLHITQP